MLSKVLKIDMDWEPPSGWLDDWFEMARLVIVGQFKNFAMNRKVEKSQNGGLHIRYELVCAMPAMDIVKLQFILGDDRTRCKLNKVRVEGGIKDWNKLFRRKIKFKETLIKE